MDIKSKADYSIYQLNEISKLKQGWRYSPDQSSPPFKKEFIDYCFIILKTIISKFGKYKASYIFPIIGGTSIQFEFREKQEHKLGYLEIVIHEDKYIEILYVTEEGIINKTYAKYNEVCYYNKIIEVILDCIEKYFNNNLYNNFIKKNVTFVDKDMLTHPSETIIGLMVVEKISESELAKQLNITNIEIENLLNGNLKINKVLSSKLEDVFDLPSSFWLNLQDNYDKEIEKYGKVLRSTETSNKQMDEE